MPLLTCQSELRHLGPQERRYIEERLDDSHSWRDLIEIIPKQLDPLTGDTEEDARSTTDSASGRLELLIDQSKYQLLENQMQLKNGSPSRALLDYWSTYGQRRPTVEHLLYYAAGCKLNRLVNYLLFDLAKVHLSSAELARKTRTFLINSFFFDEEQDEKLKQFIDKLAREGDLGRDSSDPEKPRYRPELFSVHKAGGPPSDEDATAVDLGIKCLPFELVEKATNGFNETAVKDKGNLLGRGGFGKVFLARMATDQPLNEQLVAVKVVANEFKGQYLTELKTLAEYRHPNLLDLIGYSRGPWQGQDTLCILSEYMMNGSLKDCLLEVNVRPIEYRQRVVIIGQIIDAICHLHTCKPGSPLVHRDITSNNILLDRNFNAKLCDFGLARQLSSKDETKTSNAIGTSCYMPIESLRGNHKI